MAFNFRPLLIKELHLLIGLAGMLYIPAFVIGY